jgi:hypothetical protein
MKKVNYSCLAKYFQLTKKFSVIEGIETVCCVYFHDNTAPVRPDKPATVGTCTSKLFSIVDACTAQKFSGNKQSQRYNQTLTKDLCVTVNGGVGPWKPDNPVSAETTETSTIPPYTPENGG